MDNLEIYWVFELVINPGRFEDLKTLMAAMVEATLPLLGFRRVHHRVFTRSRWRLPSLVTKALFSHPKSSLIRNLSGTRPSR
jgi:hypothetical protein